jgi:symplekin
MAAESPMRKLVEARKLCLLNADNYIPLIPTILPIIAANTSLELRRWGADFIAETLASPMLSDEDKRTLTLQLLPLLKDYLEFPSQDDAVVMSTLSAAASAYPIIFKYM